MITEHPKVDFQEAPEAEALEIIRSRKLVPIRHTVADCIIWYDEHEAKVCKSYFDITPYVRRTYLYDDQPYYVNRAAI